MSALAGGVCVSPAVVESTEAGAAMQGGVWVSPGAQGGVCVSPARADPASMSANVRVANTVLIFFMVLSLKFSKGLSCITRPPILFELAQGGRLIIKLTERQASHGLTVSNEKRN